MPLHSNYSSIKRYTSKKTVILTALSAFLIIAALFALQADYQKKSDYNVIFQVTSADAAIGNSLIRNIAHARTALHGKVAIEVIAYGNGIAFLLKDSPLSAGIKSQADSGVKFLACQNTLTSKGLTADALLPYVTVVDSGVAQLIRRQRDGWAVIHVTD